MLNISVSGFYEWRQCDKAHRFGIVETDDFIVQTLKAVIKNTCSGHIPGVLVCYHYLLEQGLSIDLKRLRRLMRENGLALLSQCYRFRNAPIGGIQLWNAHGQAACCGRLIESFSA